MAEGDRITTTENFGASPRSSSSTRSSARTAEPSSSASTATPVDVTVLHEHVAAIRAQLSQLPNSEQLANIYAKLADVDVQLDDIAALLTDLEVQKDALSEEASTT